MPDEPLYRLCRSGLPPGVFGPLLAYGYTPA
jgi:hypothetical protein